jgi:hypothetical protein
MTLIANAVHDVTSSPAPVLFLDTCVLLDIVRAPLRNAANEVRVARLLQAAVTKIPKKIHLAVGSPTATEWADHIGEVVSDCTTAVNSYDSLADVYGYMAVPGVAHLPAPVPNLPKLLRDLSADLLASIITLDHDAGAMDRAIKRVINAKKPATKGGRGVKDAVIMEHSLEMTRQLRLAGFLETCVFVSSNTTDFAASKTSPLLHPLLVPDFATPVNLLYATSLARAEAMLLANSWVP